MLFTLPNDNGIYGNNRNRISGCYGQRGVHINLTVRGRAGELLIQQPDPHRIIERHRVRVMEGIIYIRENIEYLFIMPYRDCSVRPSPGSAVSRLVTPEGHAIYADDRRSCFSSHG